MKRNFPHLLFFSFFLFAVSCSAPPILRLRPLANDTQWLDGREYAKSTAGDIEVVVAFESMDEAFIVFDVEVTNLADQPLLISPEKFYYLALSSPQDTISVPIPNQVSFAIDPETKILDIDKEISREEAGYATTSGIDAAICFLDLIVDLATIGKKKSAEEIKQDELQEREDEVRRRENDIDHENRLAEIKKMKEEWKSTTLRRTTLDPNQTVAGRVYFLTNRKARYLKLFFPLADANGQIIFEQTKYKP